MSVLEQNQKIEVNLSVKFSHCFWAHNKQNGFGCLQLIHWKTNSLLSSIHRAVFLHSLNSWPASIERGTTHPAVSRSCRSVGPRTYLGLQDFRQGSPSGAGRRGTAGAAWLWIDFANLSSTGSLFHLMRQRDWEHRLTALRSDVVPPPLHHTLKGDEEVARWCILNSKEGFFYGFLKKGTHHLSFMAGAVVTAAAGTLSAKAPSSGTATAHLRSYIQVGRGDLIRTFIQNQRRKDDFGMHEIFTNTPEMSDQSPNLENGTFKC